MTRRPRLRRLIVLALVCYTAVLALVVSLHGHFVNEQVESIIWQSMLDGELTYMKRRLAQDPQYDWSDPELFYWYDESRDRNIPEPFQQLSEGVHEEITVGSRQFVVLVEEAPQGRVMMALDVTDIEQRELAVAGVMVVSIILVVVLLTVISFYGVDRLLRPLVRIADQVEGLQPGDAGPPIEVDPRAAHETFIIAEAINGFTGRIQSHIERERKFINMASHELRTPIAAMAGANEVLLAHPDVTPELRRHLLRSNHIVAQMQDLVEVLLAMARSPQRLLASAEQVLLADIVRQVVADHQHLCAGKALTIDVSLDESQSVFAAPHIPQVAIGNLLRNAIENSDHGVIQVRSVPQGLIIEDPGQGMDAVQLSELYTRMVREGQHNSGGIGIELIMQICEHFGWRLQFQSVPGRGTRASLYFA